MKEFKINNLLSLRLEKGKSKIYVDGNEFMICKSLKIQIPKNKVKYFNNIKSIDEASEFSDENNLGEANNDIDPEIEFWGHCSNLQVWAESEYDTKLLHSNIAFPLLEELTRKGDFVARKVFKKEITKRLTDKYIPTIMYLVMEGYLQYFDQEEFKTLINEFREEAKSHNGELISQIFNEVRDEEQVALNCRQIIFFIECPEINLFELLIKFGKKYFKDNLIGPFIDWTSRILKELSKEEPQYLKDNVIELIKKDIIKIRKNSGKESNFRYNYSLMDDFSIMLFNSVYYGLKCREFDDIIEKL